MPSAEPSQQASADLAQKQDITSFEWTRDYQPWRLLGSAFSFQIPIALVLVFMWYNICTWNSDNHLVLMHCQPDTLGRWVYPCEATKAIARGFPLIAVSVSLIATGRFILQRRLYYQLLCRGALMDFTNFKPLTDSLVFVLLCSFFLGLCHFIMDFYFPPHTYYVISSKILQILITFVVPSCMFFVVFGSLYNIERHLVSLAKVYEEDSAWAKEHLGASEMYADLTVKQASREAQSKLRHSVGVGPYSYSLEELLAETIKSSETHSGTRYGTVMMNIPKGNTFVGFWQGFWPGRIVLDPALRDEGSRAFRKAWWCYCIIFLLAQLSILTVFSIRAVREVWETMPEDFPPNTLRVGTEGFNLMGNGYCRDDSMQRPDGYYKPLWRLTLTPEEEAAAPAWRFSQSAGSLVSNAFDRESPEFLGCARHCAETKKCIGFAVDLDLCNIYIGSPASAPAGWYDLAEKNPRVSSIRRHVAILQTTGADESQCWKKFLRSGQPQDIAGAIVFALHAIFIAQIIFNAIYLQINNERNTSYDPNEDPL